MDDGGFASLDFKIPTWTFFLPLLYSHFLPPQLFLFLYFLTHQNLNIPIIWFMIIHSCYYMKKPSSSPCPNHVLPKGCLFSRILRRILCLNALPWRPFDHRHQQQQQQHQPLLIKECQEVVENKDCSLLIENAASDRIVAPGLVARLMGLESLPNGGDENSTAWQVVCKGRKVITHYQELEEDDEFYTLRFGDKSCRKKQRRRRRRRADFRNKENEGTAAIRASKGDSRIALGVLMNRNNGCENDQTVVNPTLEAVNCSENSSPDSVLEFLEFPPDDQTTAKGSNRRVGNSKMRRTLSDELESCRSPDEEKREEMNVKEKKKKRRDGGRNESSLIRKTGKLAGMEMGMGRRRWDEEEDEVNVKEVGREVASQILDHLLDEFLNMLD